MTIFSILGPKTNGQFRQRHCWQGFPSGAILVWFALLLIVLLGMVGLVIDAGLLMGTHRQAQNAADAAALAAALDLMYGKSDAEATTTAIKFAEDYCISEDPIRPHLTVLPTEVHIPPATGPYAGMPGYVEVIPKYQLPTFFIHVLNLLPGASVASDNAVEARAVAGYERVSSGDGVCVLDPSRTGLTVAGTATLKVWGDVVVLSEGGGKTADGSDVGIDATYTSHG